MTTVSEDNQDQKLKQTKNKRTGKTEDRSRNQECQKFRKSKYRMSRRQKNIKVRPEE